MIRLFYIFASATGASAAAAEPPTETLESDLINRRCVIHWRGSHKKGFDVNLQMDGNQLIALRDYPLHGIISKRNEQGTYSIKIESDCPNFQVFKNSAYESAIAGLARAVHRDDFGLLYNLQNIERDPSLNGQTAMEVQLDKSGKERWKI
jgi:hypothetical protein